MALASLFVRGSSGSSKLYILLILGKRPILLLTSHFVSIINYVPFGFDFNSSLFTLFIFSSRTVDSNEYVH